MLVAQYHGGLVALSLAVAVAATYVALDLAGRVTASSGRARRAWLGGGAWAIGAGVWSLHYLGMLAYALPIALHYDLRLVLLSLLPAVLASGLALFVASRDQLTPMATVAASVAMGLGISLTHAIGMAAMRLQAVQRDDPAFGAVGGAIAILVSGAALRTAYHLRGERRAFAPRKVVSALVLGLALGSAHYVSMAAASFWPDASRPDLNDSVNISTLGIVGLMAVTAMVLTLAVLWARLDQQFGDHAAAIRATEHRYRQLFNRSLAGVYQSTLDGRMLDCNDAMAHTLGFASRAEMLALGAQALYADPADRSRWIAQLETHHMLPGYEHQLMRRDGRPVWVIESATLVASIDGGPAVIEGTIVDITARRVAERRLAETSESLAASLERYRKLVETTNAVPWEVDVATQEWRYLSPQAMRIFGYEAADVVGRPFSWTAVHVDDRDDLRRRFRALIAGPVGTNLEVEYRLYRKSGGIAVVRSVVVLAADASGRPLLRGLSLDITAQRQLEIELQQAQKLESVGRLAAGVAHEINTPVQFVSDSLHFVRDGSAVLEPFVRAYRGLAAAADPEALALARQQVAAAEDVADLDYLLEHLPQALALSLEGLDRVARIVRSMKEFAHADAGAMTAVDLNRAIESTLIVARHEYRYVAEVVLDLGELPPVTCHNGEINQAVLNVIVNAAHAISDQVRGTDRLGRITIRTARDGDTVLVAIADTGGGIPEAAQTKVFEPFFTTKAVGRGSGQGLSIARAIVVDHHGGDLRFETEPGVGTTFYLRLPVIARPLARSAA